MSQRLTFRKPGALDFLGLPLHPVSADEILGLIEEVIRNKGKALMPHLNVHGVNLALADETLKRFYQESQLVFCDGDGVRWGCKMLGLPVPPKVTYDRWVWQLCDFCNKKRFSLYFLGAKPGVAEQAAGRLKAQYPGLRIVGVRDGYFSKQGEENESVIRAINQLEPDLLIVGFGMPLQEKWLQENWKRIQARIFLTGGAVFDYASGLAKRAPRWMIQWQMEWLFRLIQEPRRLFVRYVWGIPRFFLRIFIARLTQNLHLP